MSRGGNDIDSADNYPHDNRGLHDHRREHDDFKYDDHVDHLVDHYDASYQYDPVHNVLFRRHDHSVVRTVNVFDADADDRRRKLIDRLADHDGSGRALNDRWGKRTARPIRPKHVCTPACGTWPTHVDD